MRRYIFLFSFLFIGIASSYSQTIADTSFTETNITLHTQTGDLYGTLTTPETGTPCPLVLLIAGSGPTDRNGNSMQMKTDAYAMLAHRLAEKNIASIRYDKRGVAASMLSAKKEADLRFDDYISDAKNWVQLVKAGKRFSKIIILGHSEGSLIGMIAATTDVDQFISLAGAGEPINEILKTQLTNVPQPVKDVAFAIIDSLQQGKLVDSINPALSTLFRPSVQPYLISWMKYNPQQEIKKLHIPVLLLQGNKDLQVTVADAQALKQAKPGSKLVLITDMNHVLKKITGDTPENVKSYTDPSLPIDDDLVQNIVSFIEGK